MTTARCFGGVLDGRWQSLDGRELMAPVMDYSYKAMTFDDPDYGLSPMRVHRYTLQKFCVGMEWVQPPEWRGRLEVFDHVPIIFYALIGPGFTVKMVEAWLQGWVEEAEKLSNMEGEDADEAGRQGAGRSGRVGTQVEEPRGLHSGASRSADS